MLKYKIINNKQRREKTFSPDLRYYEHFHKTIMTKRDLKL